MFGLKHRRKYDFSLQIHLSIDQFDIDIAIQLSFYTDNFKEYYCTKAYRQFPNPNPENNFKIVDLETNDSAGRRDGPSGLVHALHGLVEDNKCLPMLLSATILYPNGKGKASLDRSNLSSLCSPWSYDT